jgi:hypothetical protein
MKSNQLPLDCRAGQLGFKAVLVSKGGIGYTSVCSPLLGG